MMPSTPPRPFDPVYELALALADWPDAISFLAAIEMRGPVTTTDRTYRALCAVLARSGPHAWRGIMASFAAGLETEAERQAVLLARDLYLEGALAPDLHPVVAIPAQIVDPLGARYSPFAGLRPVITDQRTALAIAACLEVR